MVGKLEKHKIVKGKNKQKSHTVVVVTSLPVCLRSVSIRYFQCLPKFGLFAPVHKVIRFGFPSTSPAKAKKSKRMAMGVSSLAHSPSSSSISSVSSVASSVGGRPSRAGLVSPAYNI